MKMLNIIMAAVFVIASVCMTVPAFAVTVSGGFAGGVGKIGGAGPTGGSGNALASSSGAGGVTAAATQSAASASGLQALSGRDDSASGNKPRQYGTFITMTGNLYNKSNMATRDAILSNPNVTGAQMTLKWIDVQPTSSTQYDWSVVDNFLTNYCPNGSGKSCAFKFTAIGAGAEDGTTGDLTPPWLFNDPAVAYIGGINTPIGYAPRMPVYWSPAYLNHLRNFINAFGERYGKDSRIAFMRIGGFQNGTNEPTFYHPFSAYLADQIRAAGMDLTVDSKGTGVKLYANSPYTTAVLNIAAMWVAAMDRNKLVATIHFNDDPNSFEHAMNAGMVAQGIDMVNTGLNEGDKADSRTKFAYWFQSTQKAVRVGWGAITNLGSKNSGLTGMDLRMETIKQGTGLASDPQYSPMAHISYLIVGPEFATTYAAALAYAKPNMELY